MHVNGDRFAQHLERGGGGICCLCSRGRPTWPNATAEHRTDRYKHCVPHPVSARKLMGMTAAIHGLLPNNMWRSVRRGPRKLQATMIGRSGLCCPPSAALESERKQPTVLF